MNDSLIGSDEILLNKLSDEFLNDTSTELKSMVL